MIKALLFALALSAISACPRVQAQTNGFVVFEIGRLTYAPGNSGRGTELKQSFKVQLTEEFMAQFKNVPSQHSSGTGFWCGGGNLRSAKGSTAFAWWIHKTADDRWTVNMWGKGVEVLNGADVSSRNPSASQSMKLQRWEDLDMSYMLSYFGKQECINISFRARYVAAKYIDHEGIIPVAPVRKSDKTELFRGDDVSRFPLELHCGFQEG